jgi:periplasmic protein CpxP/Spy
VLTKLKKGNIMVKFDTLKNSSFARASLVVATLLALGSISTSLSAAPEVQGDRCERGHMEGGPYGHAGGLAPLPHLLHQLDLSEAQKDKVFAITYAEIPQMRENRKQHEKLMEELVATSRTDQFDDKKAQVVADKLATLEKQEALAHARTDAKLYALLTPEQKEKVKAIADKAKEQRAGIDFPGKDEPVNFKHGRHGEHPAKMM